MEFDWKPIAGTLIKAGAPVIGGALAGPLGSAAGNMLGGILANYLGVEATPEAVQDAVTSGDAATVKDALSKADAEATAKWDAIARIAQSMAEVDKANAEQVNETIRAEAAQGVPWWHWRHLIGYLVLLYGLEQVAAIGYTMFGKGVPPDQLSMLFNSTGFFTLGLFGLLGYVAQDSSKLKSVAMTGEHPPSMTATIAKAITGKKK